MFVPEFRKTAMESADSYLKYLLETDKGIAEIPVKKVDIVFPYVHLYLRGSLPAVDLELFSIYIYGDKFDLRLFSPQYYDEKARCISLTPGETQLHYFSAPPAHIKIISDFRFLVQRVFHWYSLNGGMLRLPRSAPDVSPLPLSSLSGGLPSEEQYAAYQGVLTSPFSYVWGAPGTGKTCFVLANCILTYLLQEKRILLLAPTNNALEQMLSSIIPMLDYYNIPHRRIHRVGIPSRQFREKYPDVCGDLYVSQKIEKCTAELSKLRSLLPLCDANEAYRKALRILSDYRSICEEQCAVSVELSALDASVSSLSAQLSELRSQNAAYTASIKKNTRWQKTICGKVSRLLHTRKYAEVCQAITAAASISANTLQSISLQEQRLADLSKTYASTRASFLSLRARADASVAALNSLLQSSPLSGKLRSVRSALKSSDHSTAAADKLIASVSKSQQLFSTQLAAQCSALPSLEQIQKDIRSLEESIKALSADAQEVFAVAMTADRFLLSEPSHTSYSHVFVDEAAYLSVIKFMATFSLHIPIALFGDHMQLPPVCELSPQKRFLSDGSDAAYLWIRSSVYSDAIMQLSPSSLKFPGPDPSFSSIRLYYLTATYRFGSELSSVLSKYIYPFPLTSKADSLSIYYVTCPHSSSDTRNTSAGECSACASLLNYLAKHNADCAALTPYRKQLAKIISAAPVAASQNRVLTVHASQGREWDIVLLSVVDGKRKFFMNSSIEIGRYVLNTAISRTRRAIVLLLDPSCWEGENQIISELMRSALPLNISNPTPLLSV